MFHKNINVILYQNYLEFGPQIERRLWLILSDFCLSKGLLVDITVNDKTAYCSFKLLMLYKQALPITIGFCFNNFWFNYGKNTAEVM